MIRGHETTDCLSSADLAGAIAGVIPIGEISSIVVVDVIITQPRP